MFPKKRNWEHRKNISKKGDLAMNKSLHNVTLLTVKKYNHKKLTVKYLTLLSIILFTLSISGCAAETKSSSDSRSGNL